MIVTNTKPHLTKRIIATIIDYGIFYMFLLIYIGFFGQDNGDGVQEVTGLMTLPVIIVWFIYFVLSEIMFSGTLGHQLFELEVRAKDGSKIYFTQAIKRRLLDPIDLFMWGIPAIISIKNTDQHQRLGDLWAGTTILKIENKKAIDDANEV